MKIGFFTDSYFPEIDGVTYTLKTWREELEDRGHEVYIVYPGSGDYEPSENEFPARSFPNPLYPGYRIPVPVLDPGCPELDLVHCHGPGPLGISGLFYARRHDIPAVYTHHTPLEEYFEQATRSRIISSVLEKIYLPLENFLLRRFDARTASVGEPSRSAEFQELPVGVDTEFFRPVSESLEGEWERPIAGYTGRMSMEKNVMELLELAEDFDGTLLMVGEGPLREKVDAEKPDNVVTMDFVPREQLPTIYSTIDVFVTASTGDTLGLSTLEANACGTPVVAPDVFPFAHTLSGGNGLRYSREKEGDFIEKLNKALGRQFDTREAVRRFSLERAVDSLEEIYTEVV